MKERVLKMQPLRGNFKLIGKEKDYLFQALAYMGEASAQISWANTVLEDVDKVPRELKDSMIQVNQVIHDLQDKLRKINAK
ncbi:hypothetical protein DN390_28835 [Bacillus sp. SH7-1]|uniref:hypothetical protein n=1 Tax=Bacillus sp. SH7-1 TaxID=2217818 RepID=UPI0011C88156|nr:hypothetical protein [Bacillus sp. SH7-1]TXR91726.1 hypothetical protein DN390_28835 [Bacillus sp. SH7-1]